MSGIPAIKSATLTFQERSAESHGDIPASREDVIGRLLQQKDARLETAADAAKSYNDETCGLINLVA